MFFNLGFASADNYMWSVTFLILLAMGRNILYRRVGARTSYLRSARKNVLSRLARKNVPSRLNIHARSARDGTFLLPPDDIYIYVHFITEIYTLFRIIYIFYFQ